MRHTFEIKYNDFGICHVVAATLSEAEKLFLESGYGVGGSDLRGNPVEIKSIIKLDALQAPLVSEPN